MYAIVRAGGRQEKVEVGDVLVVDRMAGEPGASVQLPAVLLVDGASVTTDKAALGKVKVTAEIVDHRRGPKIDILKYKNKIGYRRRQGHRSELTAVKVTDIKTAEQCPSCNGTGKVEASILVTDRIEGALQAAADRGLGQVTLLLHPMVEAYIKRGFWDNQLKRWKKAFGMKIVVDGNSSMELLEHHVYNAEGEEITL